MNGLLDALFLHWWVGGSVYLALDGLGDVVDVLGLDQGLEVVFEDAGEVVLELASSVVLGGWVGGWVDERIQDPANHSPTHPQTYRKYAKISAQSGGLSNRPRLGFSFPARIFKAVLFPVPF